MPQRGERRKGKYFSLIRPCVRKHDNQCNNHNKPFLGPCSVVELTHVLSLALPAACEEGNCQSDFTEPQEGRTTGAQGHRAGEPRGVRKGDATGSAPRAPGPSRPVQGLLPLVLHTGTMNFLVPARCFLR